MLGADLAYDAAAEVPPGIGRRGASHDAEACKPDSGSHAVGIVAARIGGRGPSSGTSMMPVRKQRQGAARKRSPRSSSAIPSIGCLHDRC